MTAADALRNQTALVEDAWCEDGFGDTLAAFPDLVDTVLAAEQLVRVGDEDRWAYEGESQDLSVPDVSIRVEPDEPGDAYLTLDYDTDPCAYRLDRVPHDAAPPDLDHHVADYTYRIQEYTTDTPHDGDPAAAAYAAVRAWQTKPDPTSVGLLDIDVAVTRHG